MATRKATENVSEESTTATERPATIEERIAEAEAQVHYLHNEMAGIAEIKMLVNHLLNSREHIAHCGSDHFANDWR